MRGVNKNIIYIGTVVVVVVVGGVVLMLGKQSGPAVTNNPADTIVEQQPEEQIAGPTVEIKDFAFSQTTITIKKGETITWVNKDVAGHSATADDKSFDTGVLAQGEEGAVTFENTGTFSYHCTPHPNMKANVIVIE